MYFKVLKSSLDGICGGESRYETIEEVLREISYHKGWASKELLHATIEKWAKKAHPGSVFCTQASAVIALPTDDSMRADDVCYYCDEIGLDYGDIDATENGTLEQKVRCGHCGKQWVDVFTLADQREIKGE